MCSEWSSWDRVWEISHVKWEVKIFDSEKGLGTVHNIKCTMRGPQWKGGKKGQKEKMKEVWAGGAIGHCSKGIIAISGVQKGSNTGG